MGQYAFCQNLTQLYAFLIEAVYIPCKALEHNLIFKMCKQCPQSLRGQLVADDNAGRTSAFEILIAVIICLTAGKCNDLCSHVCAQLLLAGAALNDNVRADLAVLKSDKLQRNDIGSLMQQLIEGMLSVGSGLTKDQRACHIIHRLTKAVNGFTIGFHIHLL